MLWQVVKHRVEFKNGIEAVFVSTIAYEMENFPMSSWDTLGIQMIWMDDVYTWETTHKFKIEEVFSVHGFDTGGIVGYCPPEFLCCKCKRPRRHVNHPKLLHL